MRAKFVGNGRDDPAVLNWGGVVWPLGEAVEVPPHLEAKVRGNAHFQVARGRPPKAKVKADGEDAA